MIVMYSLEGRERIVVLKRPEDPSSTIVPDLVTPKTCSENEQIISDVNEEKV
jgi:hypothetical protein